MRVSYLPRPARAFGVLSPVSIFRAIGRRPSAVRVDEAMRPTLSEQAPHRLSDTVYARAEAVPGEEIQEHGRGLVLVSADGKSHTISLTPPRPLDPETAFNHAALAIKADLQALEELLRARTLAEIEPQKRATMPRPQRQEFAEDHPLVVEQLS
jgi:hypothetical protein